MGFYKVISASGRSAVVEAANEQRARILGLAELEKLHPGSTREEVLDVVSLEVLHEEHRDGLRAG